ncbi:hypothetical protein NFA_20480 [Nocardia farcinica IFM 10152]|uniref:NorR-like AAA+ ATPase lid domain-containing protein n=1 Tax=Nocardia farcinica (strain IFM 10152) TaxID=247156 RepID=Q5YY47_NOCFA|nr:hypothetical protein NFA_20480 [Nocardia farcinica IFM 10152]
MVARHVRPARSVRVFRLTRDIDADDLSADLETEKPPRRTSASFSPTCVRLSPAAHRQLTKLPWPGNVAQLRRVLSDTLSRQRFGTITPDVLPPECHALTRRPPPSDDPLRVDARSTHRFGRPAAHTPADQADRAPVHTRCPDLDSPRRG